MNNNQHLIRAARISLAMLIGFIYVRVVCVNDGIWVLMTCAIVLFDNSTVGGAIAKGYYRMLGTILAAVYSILVVVVFANSTIANIIAIITSVFFAAYYFMDTKKAYIGGLIAWTTPIMLLNSHNLSSIFIRPLNILIGIIISYFVQRFFYPEYAKNTVLNSFSGLIAKANILLNHTLDNKILSKTEKLALEEMEVGVVATINKASKLIDETNTELPKVLEYGKICSDLVTHLRRIFKFIVVFSHQLDDTIIIMSPELRLVIKNIALILDKMHEHLNCNINHYHLAKDFSEIKNILHELENKQFITCLNEEILLPQIIVKELDLVYILMLQLFKIRQQYKMY